MVSESCNFEGHEGQKTDVFQAGISGDILVRHLVLWLVVFLISSGIQQVLKASGPSAVLLFLVRD